jgi:competence ComEA-like helix-hairpin-helix protein
MPAEHRAVLLLLGLAVAGHGVRYLLTRPGDAPGAVTLLGTGPARSAGAQRDSVLSRARPLAAGERIDVDRATVAELDRLPGVGPGLARRIVADREMRGSFGSLAGLDRVNGVGPALLRALEERVAFSGPAADTPGEAAPGSTVDLNSASRTALLTLPGIGPAKADAIVAYREAHGPFASVEALLSVPGIGPSIFARVKDLARVQ